MSNPLAVALQGKGVHNLLQRSMAIGERYGLTPGRMMRAIDRFAGILEAYRCGATFPLTARTLGQDEGLAHLQDRGIEFAIHGYRHIDHSLLSTEQLIEDLTRAQQLFQRHGLSYSGFRCPYLRWNQDVMAALVKLGFKYDSSQALAWDVVYEARTADYDRVLEFYGAQSAADCTSLPHIQDGLVCMPYSVPDDEALVERLHLEYDAPMAEIWLAILDRTWQLGELFVLGLHPERTLACQEPLRAVLQQARSKKPTVWIARLDEIAAWWSSRELVTYEITGESPGSSWLSVNVPSGNVLLCRSMAVQVPTEPWAGGYRRVLATDFGFEGDKLPLIGVAPDSPPELSHFLRQQGYLVCIDADPSIWTCYFDRRTFGLHDEREILSDIEQGDWPLVRLARWPDGAQSALAVTGDIDALSLWDYALRILDR